MATKRATPSYAELVARNPDRHRATRRRAVYNLKLKVIALYGGKCACCGTTVVDFLTIDHVHGGGGFERKNLSRGKSSWQMAREEHGTDKYQLLCMNCNQSKQINGGICCHQGGTPKETDNKATKRYRRIRTTLVTQLGGVCACCGETELGFLNVDHVNNDGAAHREERGYRGSLRDMAKSGYDRTRYQVLCANCNTSKQLSGGIGCTCKIGRVPNQPTPRKLVQISLLSPNGEIVEIVNLDGFCKERGLDSSTIRHVISGKRKSHKGWSLVRTDNMTALTDSVSC